MKRLFKHLKNSLLSVLVLSLFFVSLPKVSAHFDKAYWNETKTTTPYTTHYAEWMSTLADDLHLTEISLPGTHDTMAHKASLPFRNIVRTQSMDLEQQLLSGIRYLDIRVAHRGKHFQLHHGSIDLGYRLENVLDTIEKFLKDHPTETVLMRFKQEHTRASNEEMLSLFYTYHDKYKHLFWDPFESQNSYDPLLKEVRGKIVLLSDVRSIYQGIAYTNAKIQDKYHLNTNWDLYKKWEYVKETLEHANQINGHRFVINYLSGSGGSFPYFVASGHVTASTYGSRLSTGLTEPLFRHRYPDFPRVARLGVFATIAFEGTNTLTADYLRKNQLRRAGIVVADFPGERLIDEIIQCNYRHR